MKCWLPVMCQLKLKLEQPQRSDKGPARDNHKDASPNSGRAEEQQVESILRAEVVDGSTTSALEEVIV